MNKLDKSRAASLRALGGRSPAPAVSVWGPVAAKILLAVVLAGVLAVIGVKAGSSAAGAVPAPVASAEPGERTRGDAGPSLPAASGFDAGAEPRSGALPDGRVVLNVAEEEDLVKLPGIGPTRARAIVALRHRLGRFRAVEDLLRVRGIGRKTLRRIRPSVILDAPRVASAEKDAG